MPPAGLLSARASVTLPPRSSGVPASIMRAVWTFTILLAIIGVAVVIRRAIQLLVLPAPSASRGPFDLDPTFSGHRLLTMLHITPGLLFMVLVPLQFNRALRTRRPRLHRWTGRILVASGLVIGVTALVMSPQMAIGGLNEQVAIMLFAAVFLFALVKAYLAIRRGNVALHREWMIRVFAVGFAVAFIRPIVGIFFATSRLTHLTPHDFFGTAFWLGFTVCFIAGEVWINYTRTRN